jgi:signal transduction histidine kinase
MPTHRAAAPLVRQLVLPTVGLVLAAVVANVGFASWLAVRRTREATQARQMQVTRALEGSRVAVSPQVLDTLRQLTGSHFVVWDTARSAPGLTTLPTEAVDAGRLSALVDGGGGTATVAGASMHVGRARSTGVRPETVLVLTPVRGIWATTVESAWPVLAVGVATLAVLVPLGLTATTRLSHQITTIERHVARIAGGDFGATLVAVEGGPQAAAEVERLARGVDSLSTTLAALRSSLVAGERQRLLGQLAAGFAHELRNAITGARLAIDLHRRRCHATCAPDATRTALHGDAAAATTSSDDDSLAVAIHQLDIVTAEIRGLLALGRPDTSAPVAVDVAALVARVGDLVGPRCGHAGVRLEQHAAAGLSTVGQPEALRAALVNLALNAIDAVGRDGLVRIVAERLPAADRNSGVTIAVEDDGPGPPPALAETLCEPFVTGKPEGIGLGLAVARAVAEQHGGTLGWSRTDGRTRFTITLPDAAVAAETPA